MLNRHSFIIHLFRLASAVLLLAGLCFTVADGTAVRAEAPPVKPRLTSSAGCLIYSPLASGGQ